MSDDWTRKLGEDLGRMMGIDKIRADQDRQASKNEEVKDRGVDSLVQHGVDAWHNEGDPHITVMDNGVYARLTHKGGSRWHVGVEHPGYDTHQDHITARPESLGSAYLQHLGKPDVQRHLAEN